jgi:hypothetical protein
MSFDEARVFIKRIKERTGRYPLVYANNLVTKAIADHHYQQLLTVTGSCNIVPAPRN